MLLDEVVQRLHDADELFGACGLRGQDPRGVGRGHPSLGLRVVVVVARAGEVELEAGIRLLDGVDEGLPLGAVRLAGHPGEHLGRGLLVRTLAG